MIHNIIIDCDPGHDDAIAILIAIANHDKLKVLALGTVGGNHDLDKVTINAQRVLQMVHSSIPLYKGASKPLERTLETQASAHGDSGMDGPIYSDSLNYKVESMDAIEAYRMLIKKHDDVTLVGIGPLTNIALLIKKYPEVCKRIKQISIMGGGTHMGNVSAAAEFNIYADPEAAQIVFQSGIPIIMSGLDVTEKAFITPYEIDYLKDEEGISQFVYELLQFYNNSGKQFGFSNSAIHDACAIVYLVSPEIFDFEMWHVDIVTDGIARGMTLADKRMMGNKENLVKVLTSIDRSQFIKLLFDAINSF